MEEQELNKVWRNFLGHMFSYIMNDNLHNSRIMSKYLFSHATDQKEWWFKKNPLDEDKAITNLQYTKLTEPDRNGYARDPAYSLFYKECLVVYIDTKDNLLGAKNTGVVNEQNNHPDRITDYDLVEFFMKTPESKVQDILEILRTRTAPLLFENRVQKAREKKQKQEMMTASIQNYFNKNASRQTLFMISMTKLETDLRRRFSNTRLEDMYMKTFILKFLEEDTTIQTKILGSVESPEKRLEELKQMTTPQLEQLTKRVREELEKQKEE